MYTFSFYYSDGSARHYEHITTAKVGNEVISEKEILTYDFWANQRIFLKSDTGNYTVSTNDLRSIEVEKES